MLTVDLNCDMGESFGAYSLGRDEAVLAHVSSVNIACGFHAGDFAVLSQTVKRAKAHHAAIGAHPGLPDLQGFGRRYMAVSPEDVYHMVVYQLGAIQAVCHTHQVPLHHVKAHGALYHMVCQEPSYAQALVQAVSDVDQELQVFGLSGSRLLEIGEAAGLSMVSEVFADRAYEDNGQLVSREQPQAVLENIEQAAERAIDMITKGNVISVNGYALAVRADTICVHGDGYRAQSLAAALQESLQTKGIHMAPIGG